MKRATHSPKVSKARTIRLAQIFISQDSGVPYKFSKPAIKSFIKFIAHELSQGRRVWVDGLGIFFLARRTARTTKVTKVDGRGLAGMIEGETALREHPEADYVKFKPGTALKKAVWKERPPVFKNKSEN